MNTVASMKVVQPCTRCRGTGAEPEVESLAALGDPITLEQAKEKHVRAVLLELGGHSVVAAKMLGISRTTLHRMKVRWGIE